MAQQYPQGFPQGHPAFFMQQGAGGPSPQQQQQQMAQAQQQAQQHAQQQQQQHPQQGQPQQQGPPGQIDPALLQSLYPQAFQALALQQQLQLMAAQGKAQQQAQQHMMQQQQQHQQQHQQQQQQQGAQQMQQGQVDPRQLQIYQAALAAGLQGGLGLDPALLHQLLPQQNAEHALRQFQAQQQRQQREQQQLAIMHANRDKGADMFDDDYEDSDSSFEDDETPRKRRKPIKKSGPSAPKGPKGGPRNYVVCKDCPQCKLKVGNNTRVCRGCGYTFNNVRHHSSAHPSHYAPVLPSPPLNPDGTPMETRKSSRKRTKANPQNSFDYLDKDEATHLQIALQNSLVETKSGDLSQVKDAPEYRPSVAEWANPIAYVEKIRLEAEAFGMAKIIPPEGWNPPYSLKDDFKFPTRMQQIHRLTEAAGFEVGKQYTPAEYEKMADDFKASWVEERNAKTGAVGQPSEEEMEQAYWRIVETAQPPTEVEYANDISNVVAGGHGAFESASEQMDPKLYAGEPSWNLNLLPHAPGSVLKSLPQSIQGITEPWLYMGMLFASFCWHNEDDYLYSMNYLHKGAPKIWYSIPGRKAQAFEKVLQRTLAQLVFDEPDLHLKLVTMLPPSLLHSHQVPVFRCVQQPGTFIVTFPKGVHAGFSLGFNVAEAVNFATDSWFQYGREALGRYRKYQRGSVLSYSQLLFDCILNGRWKYNIDILRDELLNLYESELKGRRLCRDQGVTQKVRIDTERFEPGQELECSKCRIPLYLSFVCCPCVQEHSHLIAPPRTRLPDEPAEPQQQEGGDAHQQQQQQHNGDDGAAAAAHHHQQHPHHPGDLSSQVFNPNDPNAAHDLHLQPPMPPHPLVDEHGNPLSDPLPNEQAPPAETEAEQAPPPAPVERCLDHVRHAKSVLGTDYGGQMPVLFFRHVLPELVAMDEILAQPATEEEIAGKITATQILKERTANIELDKDELPPTPPPLSAAELEAIEASTMPAAEAAASSAAAAAAAAPVVPAPEPKPKPPRAKPVRKRKIKRESDEDEDFELNPNASDDDDDDSDAENPPITLRTHNNYHHMHAAHMAGQYVPIAHPSMMHAQHSQYYGGAGMIVQPRSQPRRSTRDAGREDLKDGAYVNLDLVELDEVPGMEDDDDESRRRMAEVAINPHVRQALSAIVEAIAEVSSMKTDEEVQPMDMEQHAQAQAQAAQAQAAAQAHAQAQAHAAVVAQAAQLGISPQAFIQMQLQQHNLQQQQQAQQAHMAHAMRMQQLHQQQQLH